MANCLLQIMELIEFVTAAQHWFKSGRVGSFLQSICIRIYGSTRSFDFPAETRFGKVLIQLAKFNSMKLAIKECVGSDKYQAFEFENDIFAPRLDDDEVWQLIERVLDKAGPLLLLIRLGDLKSGTLSKLRGTTDYIKTLMVQTGDGSLEDEIANCFHNRVGALESDAANAAYMIDPQFISQSRDAPAELMNSFWLVTKKILGHAMTDEVWLPLRSQVASELQAFRMKCGGFAFEDYTMTNTCDFWGCAGCHAPHLKRIAYALAPQPCSSSEAERNWFELKSNKTKKRNRLGKETIEKMMFVRRFLRLERKVLTTTVGATDPILAKWVQRLLKDAAVSLNPDANDAGVPEGGNDEDDMEALTVFNDVIEPGEQGKINGREPGQPRVSLTNLRKDKHAQSWLFEKYYNMSLVDKNPSEEDDTDVPPLADPTKWEHRRIQNVVWGRRVGWVVDTVIIGDDSGDTETYYIDEFLLRMIRDSTANSRRIKSKIVNLTNTNVTTPPSSQTPSVSGSDSEETGEVQVV